MHETNQAQEAAANIIGDIASKTTNIGAAAAVGSSFIQNNFIGLCGVAVGVAGLLVKWYYERKTFQLLKSREDKKAGGLSD